VIQAISSVKEVELESIQRKDAPVVLEAEGTELRGAEIGGGMSVTFAKMPAGADARPAFEGLPGDLCPCPHWGYMLSGRLKMVTSEGDRVYSAGDAFYWAPGHAPVALENCEFIDFAPTKELEAVMDHTLRGGGAA
jgi:hypothetical protein